MSDSYLSSLSTLTRIMSVSLINIGILINTSAFAYLLLFLAQQSHCNSVHKAFLMQVRCTSLSVRTLQPIAGSWPLTPTSAPFFHVCLMNLVSSVKDSYEPAWCNEKFSDSSTLLCDDFCVSRFFPFLDNILTRTFYRQISVFSYENYI